MSAALAPLSPPRLVEFVCPECLKQGKRNVIIRAESGARVEAFCWKCKFRKLVTV